MYLYSRRIQLVKSTCSRKSEAIETRKFRAIKPIKCSFPTSKKYMLSKKWSHRNSKVSSHQANQMLVCTLTRINIRVHTLHTFSVFSKLEVSKWNRFSSQSNVTDTHTHICPRTYTRLMSNNTSTYKHSSYAPVWLRLLRSSRISNLLAVGVTLPLISPPRINFT